MEASTAPIRKPSKLHVIEARLGRNSVVMGMKQLFASKSALYKFRQRRSKGKVERVRAALAIMSTILFSTRGPLTPLSPRLLLISNMWYFLLFFFFVCCIDQALLQSLQKGKRRQLLRGKKLDEE